MAGYRCVYFSDLCRLCSNASSKNFQIFPNEDLQKKIAECLPIQLDEKDKLPKGICAGCKEYVEIFSDFRKATQNAQKMLEGCLNSSKIRNGGQVYIKDEAPIKKVLKPIQNPSPTKIVPNLNLIATPTNQAKKNVASPSQPDFLSTIMQAVGIQTGEDNASENNASIAHHSIQQQPPTLQGIPQYTFTLEGNTLKTGQIQYKIDNAGNLVANEELLKLKQKPGLIVRKENPQLRLTPISAEEPKNKKPKINFIIQTPTSQNQAPKVQTSQIISATTPKTTFTSPSKAQILNIEKIPPVTTQASPTKQLLVPIMVRSNGTQNTITTSTDATAQFIQQALQMSANQISAESKPAASNQPFMFMKIQPNADGQLTLMPMPAAPPQPAPQHLQLSLSPQQLQQLGIQTHQIPAQQTHAVSLQPAQLTIPTQIAQTTVTQAKQESQEKDTVIEANIDEDEIYNDSYDENYYGGDDESIGEEITLEEEEKVHDDKKLLTPKKKSAKFSKKPKSLDNYEEPPINPEHSEIAKAQMAQITNYNAKRNPDDVDAKNDPNLTICDVCKKVFKRKEFLMQHLKSHIGIRPFKCDEPTCNKSFSRKEHLLRHVSSHTGKKEYQCNICNKMFSRKDNLNKHRRIHPESGQSNLRHCCSNCEEGFSYKAQLQKHLQSCSPVKPEPIENSATKIIKTPTVQTKKVKEIEKSPTVSQQSARKIVQVVQNQSKVKSEQPQPIFISLSSLSHKQNKSGAIYTLPVVLNSNGSFVTGNGIQNLNT